MKAPDAAAESGVQALQPGAPTRSGPARRARTRTRYSDVFQHVDVHPEPSEYI